MFPCSNLFLSTVRKGGFTRTSTATVYFAGVKQVELPIADGAVDVDRTSDTRRSCTFTVADENFVPVFVNSPLAPYGAEVEIRTGIKYGDGTTELVTLGMFRIEQVTWEESAGNLPKVTGYDRSKTIADASFILPIDRSGFAAMNLLTHLVQDVSDFSVNIDPTLIDYNLPGGSSFDTDRWGAIKTIVQPMGAEAFFDVHGNFVVQTIPGLTQAAINSTTPNWTVDAGPTGVLVQASRGVSRTGVANAVTCIGAAPTGGGSAPVGYAADTDSRSPTFWGPGDRFPYGPWDFQTNFGQVVKRINNNLATDSSQCFAAAAAELKNSVGLARSLDFTTVWNPALQEGDVVKVVYLDGTYELHMIDKQHIPIGSSNDSMTCGTRTLTYQLSANT